MNPYVYAFILGFFSASALSLLIGYWRGRPRRDHKDKLPRDSYGGDWLKDAPFGWDRTAGIKKAVDYSFDDLTVGKQYLNEFPTEHDRVSAIAEGKVYFTADDHIGLST